MNSQRGKTAVVVRAALAIGPLGPLLRAPRPGGGCRQRMTERPRPGADPNTSVPVPQPDRCFGSERGVGGVFVRVRVVAGSRTGVLRVSLSKPPHADRLTAYGFRSVRNDRIRVLLDAWDSAGIRRSGSDTMRVGRAPGSGCHTRGSVWVASAVSVDSPATRYRGETVTPGRDSHTGERKSRGLSHPPVLVSPA